MIVVIGDNEVENNMIALRDRRVREQSNLTRAEFVELLKKLNSEGEV